jgi:DNA modification methylase
LFTAAELNRRYIGIDISPEYCEIARMRLKAVETGVPVSEQKQGQASLFDKE